MLQHIDSKGLAFRKSLPVTTTQLFQNPKASLYTCPVPECMCPENSNSIEEQLQSSQWATFYLQGQNLFIFEMQNFGAFVNHIFFM